MELRKPTLEDKQSLNDYKEEHYNNSEYNISASNEITSMKYENWLEKYWVGNIRNLYFNW